MRSLSCWYLQLTRLFLLFGQKMCLKLNIGDLIFFSIIFWRTLLKDCYTYLYKNKAMLGMFVLYLKSKDQTISYENSWKFFSQSIILTVPQCWPALQHLQSGHHLPKILKYHCYIQLSFQSTNVFLCFLLLEVLLSADRPTWT